MNTKPNKPDKTPEGRTLEEHESGMLHWTRIAGIAAVVSALAAVITFVLALSMGVRTFQVEDWEATRQIVFATAEANRQKVFADAEATREIQIAERENEWTIRNNTAEIQFSRIVAISPDLTANEDRTQLERTLQIGSFIPTDYQNQEVSNYRLNNSPIYLFLIIENRGKGWAEDFVIESIDWRPSIGSPSGLGSFDGKGLHLASFVIPSLQYRAILVDKLDTPPEIKNDYHNAHFTSVTVWYRYSDGRGDHRTFFELSKAVEEEIANRPNITGSWPYQAVNQEDNEALDRQILGAAFAPNWSDQTFTSIEDLHNKLYDPAFTNSLPWTISPIIGAPPVSIDNPLLPQSFP